MNFGANFVNQRESAKLKSEIVLIWYSMNEIALLRRNRCIAEKLELVEKNKLCF